MPRSASASHAIAERGVGTASGSLPHIEQIQESFGSHDVSSVTAAVGGEAAVASTGLGAVAFTYGDRVAFPGAPDLHTAAHEAAHVVQQRAGLTDLEGGEGQVGDRYEQHADAVAERVVRGESAEDLLDAFATPAAAAAPVIQRKAGPQGSTAHDYVEANRTRFFTALFDRFTHTGLAQPHPRLRWTSMAEAPRLVVAAIRAHSDEVPAQTLKQLMKLSYPVDLYAIVADARAGYPGLDWRPVVGTVLAVGLDEAMQRSLERVGARIRALVDRDATLPAATDVVVSSPLDRILARLLVTPGVVLVDPSKHGAAKDLPGRTFVEGAKEVAFEWQGKHDPTLWNWIKVTSPANAAVEDVARTPLAGGEVLAGSEQAYRIVARPPFFGIPFETAMLAGEEAFAFAPDAVKKQLAGGSKGPRVADADVFDRSSLSDDAILARTPHRVAGDTAPELALVHIDERLSYMHQRLTPWKLAGQLAGAEAFAKRRRAELAGDRKKVEIWTGSIAAQERALGVSAGEFTEIDDMLTANHVDPKHAAVLGPIVRMLEAFARAAGLSHMPAEAITALTEARKHRALLSLSFVDDSARGARASTGGISTNEFSSLKPTVDEDGDARPVPDVTTRAADLRLSMLRGQDLDPEAVDLVGVDAEESSVRARIAAISEQLRIIDKLADEAEYTKATIEHGLPTLRGLVNEVLYRRAPQWTEALDKANHWTAPVEGQSANRTMIEQRRRAVRDVDARITDFKEVTELEQWVEWSKDQIAAQQLHNALVSLAIQMGVMIVTGQIANAALVGLRGVVLGAELVNDIRGAGIAFKTAELLLHSSLATLTQGAVTNQHVGAVDIGENVVAMILSNAAMKPFQSLLHGDAALEQEMRTFGDLAKKTGKLGVELALETGTGIAASHVANKAVKGGDAGGMMSAEEWINQGISIAASRFVAVRVEKMRERVRDARAEARMAKDALAESEAQSLLARIEDLETRAVKGTTSGEQAAALVIESRNLLLAERPLQVARVARSPHDSKALAAGASNQASLSELGPDFVAVPLRLAHLSPVVEGHTYEGTSKQVHEALELADKMLRSKPGRVFDPETGIWTIAIEGRVIRILDREAIRQVAQRDHTGAGSSRPVAEDATAAPVGTFHGAARPSSEPAVVRASAASALSRLAARMQRTASGNVIELLAAGGVKRPVRVVVETMNGKRPAVAHYDEAALGGSGEIKVYLSDKAADAHIERALAHELAEIEHRLQGGAHGDDALLPGATGTELTGHDVGRLAELEVVAHQLHDARAAGDHVLASRLQADVYDLLAHLGLGSPAGEQRLRSLIERYGKTQPRLRDFERLLPELKDAARGAVRDWRAGDADAWNRADEQHAAISDLKAGKATDSQRARLAEEIQREVPDVGLMLAVHEHGAKTVVSVVTPGGGDTGIKTLNDKSIGRTFTNKLIDARNRVFRRVFQAHQLTVVQESFKTTTVVSTLPPHEVAPALKTAMAEIDAQMRIEVKQVFEESRKYWTQQRGLSEDADSRIHAIDGVLKRMHDPKFAFEFHLGAAEIAGGPSATYEQILGAEMNSTKAAIMARDPKLPRTGDTDVGDPRAMIYSEPTFIDLAKETVRQRDELKALTLPWRGRDVPVVDAAGKLNQDLARAVRSKKFDDDHLKPKDKQTLQRLKQYIDRVNTLDYIVRFKGDEVVAQGDRVAAAAALTKRLTSGGAIDAQTAQGIETTLAGTNAQEGGASEAQFFARAAQSADRVVINADIKDLGIDVIDGNARAMQQIADGEGVAGSSQRASEDVLKLKEGAMKAIDAYYRRTLVPEARKAAAARHMPFDVSETDQTKPLILLGGDEITISLPRIFEELGLVPEFVGHVQEVARARVAVTHTGTVDGAKGHADAMKIAESAHSLLKEGEQLARDLGFARDRLKEPARARARALAREFSDMYTTSDESGVTQVHAAGGAPVADLQSRINEAKSLLSQAGV